MAQSDEQTKSPARKINTEIYWLVGLFLLAAALRTIAALTRQMVGMDEASQLRMADHLLLGEKPLDITGTTSTAYGIMYPLVTASFAVMTRSVTAAGYLVSIIFGSLMILPAYLFGKVMWNRKVATAAAALVAVLPVLVDNGGLAGQQSIFAFWLGCGMFFGYRMQFTKRCMCGMLSGTCLGIAYLVDTSALYFVVVLFVLLVIIGLRQELASYATKAAVQFLVTFLVFAIPNVAWMTYETGSFTVINRPADGVYAAVNGLAPGSIEYERDVMGITADGELKLYELEEGKGLWQTLVSDPWSLVKATARADFDFYLRNAQSLIPLWLLPLMGLGLFSSVWTRREALKYGFFLMMLLPALVMTVTWGSATFVLAFLVILMVIIAKGWVYLEGWSSDTADEIVGWQKADEGHKRAVAGVLAALVMIPLAALSIWTPARADHPAPFREAGEWIAEQGEEDLLVMSREGSSAWYADGTQVILPYGTIEEVVGYGRSKDVDYIVVTRALVDDLRPELESLMDADESPGGLEAVYSSGEGTEEELIVYRLD